MLILMNVYYHFIQIWTFKEHKYNRLLNYLKKSNELSYGVTIEVQLETYMLPEFNN